MSLKFPELTKTYYPDAFDIHAVTLLDPNSTDRTLTDWEINENNIHYVLADDVNALQDAVIAIQNVLGVSPQGSSETVSQRIGIHDSQSYAPLAHKHTGQAGSSPLINLSATVGDILTDVSGQLPKTRILLSNTATNALTSQDIALSPANATNILTALDNKIDKNADATITGNLTAVQLRSSTTNQPPLHVSSTQLVERLNADQVDGFEASDFILSSQIRRWTVGLSAPIDPIENDIWLDLN